MSVATKNFRQLHFQQLLAEMSRGSEKAAWELVETYSPHIMRSVRASLPRAIRSKIDSQDFVQAVWISMLLNREDLSQFRDPAQFIGYLASVARNKVVDSNRHYMDTEGYNVHTEVSMPELHQQIIINEVITGIKKDDETEEQQLPASNDPTPSHVAMAREAWQRVVGQSCERDRQIAALRIEGHTCGVIADQLSIAERTVRRVMRRIIGELQEVDELTE